jgi:hypothetical protein
MRFWWVNQKQTHRHEIGGGFLWSPKRKANGDQNPYYDFMTEVAPDDLIFSYVHGQIVAVGIATTHAYSSSKPVDFGKAGEVWTNDGWRVNVDFRRVERPLSPTNHMELIAPLLPIRYSPIQANGRGNQVYLTSISIDLGKLLLDLLGINELGTATSSLDQLEFSPEEQELIRDQSIPETEKSTLVLARRGQGVFRNRVQFFEQSCRVTGVDQSELLIASHIKPWKDSDNEERLSGHNGLFLSPHVDKLFDAGFMTFEDSGELVFSSLLDRTVPEKWHLDSHNRVRKFGSEQSYFLEFHRTKVFRA